METKALEKTRTFWPSLSETSWMDRIFNWPIDEFFNPEKVMNVPAVNIAETEKEYKITIAAPGLEKSDFKVELDQNVLTISAEKEKEEHEEKKGKFNRREYNYTSWRRSFTLTEGTDMGKIDAKYENGELKLSIPKTEMKANKNVKQIAIH
jgi:HSP20 family protein